MNDSATINIEQTRKDLNDPFWLPALNKIEFDHVTELGYTQI